MGDWYDDLHTADDIRKAHEVLMLWAANAERRYGEGDTRFADFPEQVTESVDRIADRAAALGVE